MTRPSVGDKRFAVTNLKIEANGAKPPMALVPCKALRSVVGGLHDGAAKYAPHNYREQVDSADWRTEYASALLRHAAAFADPKEPDVAADSGIHHLAHAAACCLILLDLLGEDYVESTAVLRAKQQSPQGFGPLPK